jgi:hypothetical protein
MSGLRHWRLRCQRGGTNEKPITPSHTRTYMGFVTSSDSLRYGDTPNDALGNQMKFAFSCSVVGLEHWLLSLSLYPYAHAPAGSNATVNQ